MPVDLSLSLSLSPTLSVGLQLQLFIVVKSCRSTRSTDSTQWTSSSLRPVCYYRHIVSVSLRLASQTRSSATAEKQRVTCLPTWRGLGPSAHSPSAPSGYTYAYGRIRKPQRSHNVRTSSVPSTKRTLR